jgi:hypothetical protein
MSVDTSPEKINTAVRECLSCCYFASQPLLALADYVDALRFRKGWTDADVQEVRSAAIHILSAIAAGDDDNIPIGFTLEPRFDGPRRERGKRA